IAARIGASCASGTPGTSIEVKRIVVSHWPGCIETELPEQAAASATVGANRASFFINRSPLVRWSAESPPWPDCVALSEARQSALRRGGREAISMAHGDHHPNQPRRAR